MEKAKKIISLVLVAALLAGVCLMGGSMTTSAASVEIIDYGNLLINGNFERMENIWNQISSQGGNVGISDVQLANGQKNQFVDNWRFRDHYFISDSVTYPEKKIYFDHCTDAYSGNFSAKLRNAGTGTSDESSAKIYPTAVVGDINNYTTGSYKFSIWVKGTAIGAYINYKVAGASDYTKVNITDLKADEWTQVVIEDIEGFALNTVGNETVLDMYICYKTNDVATEFYIDDARLEYMPVEPVVPPVIDPNIVVQPGFENVDSTAVGGAITTDSFFSNTWAADSSVGGGISKYAVTDDVHTGSYALKIEPSGTEEGKSIFNLAAATADATGNLDTTDTTKFTPGNYRVSLWVKGNAIGSYLFWESSEEGNTFNKKAYVPDTAASEWKQLVIDNVKISSAEDFIVSGDGTEGNPYRYSGFGLYAVCAESTYLIIDDIRVEKYENLIGNSGCENLSGNKTSPKEYNTMHGQHLSIIDGWHGYAWFDNQGKIGRLASHITEDVHSGSYAMRLDYNSPTAWQMAPSLENLPDFERYTYQAVVENQTQPDNTEGGDTGEEGGTEEGGTGDGETGEGGTEEGGAEEGGAGDGETGEDEEVQYEDRLGYIIPAGAYRLSVWAKGTAKKIRMILPGNSQTYTNVTEEWQQFSVYVSYTEDQRLTTTKSEDGFLVAHGIKIEVSTGEEGDYLIVDDFYFEKFNDTVDSVLDQARAIRGIEQPEPDDTVLSMPSLVTDNPYIKLSVGESWNKDVVSPGTGKITEPKVRTSVGIMLKVSDGIRSVTLESEYVIYVLIHGELDQITEKIIAAAIHDLDVLSETAGQEIDTLNYWFKYKERNYVTVANRKIFYQKKLVYNHDVVKDRVLNSTDIEEVRNDLLYNDTERDIRDYVFTYKKVVEYNSYN